MTSPCILKQCLNCQALNLNLLCQPGWPCTLLCKDLFIFVCLRKKILWVCVCVSIRIVQRPKEVLVSWGSSYRCVLWNLFKLVLGSELWSSWLSSCSSFYPLKLLLHGLYPLSPGRVTLLLWLLAILEFPLLPSNSQIHLLLPPKCLSLCRVSEILLITLSCLVPSCYSLLLAFVAFFSIGPIMIMIYLLAWLLSVFLLHSIGAKTSFCSWIYAFLIPSTVWHVAGI